MVANLEWIMTFFLAEEWGQKNEAIGCLSRLEPGSSISMLSVVDLYGTDLDALKYSFATILLPLRRVVPTLRNTAR